MTTNPSVETKICPHCQQEKTLDCFYLYAPGVRHKYKPGARRPKCKQCQHDSRAEHRKANPEMAAITARKSKIKRLFGITPEDYDKMFADQNGVCAICDKESPDGRRLHIDHCHTTQNVRGLLCPDCNRGLGIFRDQVSLLDKAARYLLKQPYPKSVES